MKAVSVHGGGDVFDRISFNDGLLAEHDGECLDGTVMGVGRDEVASSPDIVPSSSSASQSAGVGLRDLEDDIEDTGEKADEDFFLSIPLRRLLLLPGRLKSFSSMGDLGSNPVCTCDDARLTTYSTRVLFYVKIPL